MATKNFPRRNLPPDSEQWGRSIEDRIRGLELSSDNDLQNGNVNRTLNLLSQQIAKLQTTLTTTTATATKLASLQTFVSQPMDLSVNSAADGVPVNSLTGPSITFTPVPNTLFLISMSAASLMSNFSSTVAQGSFLASLLTFEVVGNPGFYIGSNASSAYFYNGAVRRDDGTGYGSAASGVPVSRTVAAFAFNTTADQTVNLRLRGYGTSAGLHQANGAVLTVQIVPGSNF